MKRFPRVQDQQGTNLGILSAFSNANRDADARAFAALMKHIKDVDGARHTALMMQVENESGELGPARDYSAEAEVAWKRPVPDAMHQPGEIANAFISIDALSRHTIQAGY